MSKEKLYVDDGKGGQIEIPKQESNVFVVEEINKDVIRKAIKTMRKRYKLNTNKKFDMRASNVSELKGLPIKSKEFEDGYVHPFDFDKSKVSNLANIVYSFKGRILGFIYIFEIKK